MRRRISRLFDADGWRFVSSCCAAAVLVCTGAVLLGLLGGCGKQPVDSGRRATPGRPTYIAETLSIGNSMLPTFNQVERVRLELCAYGDLAARDTVIFWHDRTSQYVHHRLIERDATTNRWITRGDNNQGRDTGLMTADEFIGRTHKLN